MLNEESVENQLLEYGSFTRFDYVLFHAWVETWQDSAVIVHGEWYSDK